MRHIVPHPHGTFTDGELVFSTSAAVHILEVIQAAAKDAAMPQLETPELRCDLQCMSHSINTLTAALSSLPGQLQPLHTSIQVTLMTHTMVTSLQ